MSQRCALLTENDWVVLFVFNMSQRFTPLAALLVENDWGVPFVFNMSQRFTPLAALLVEKDWVVSIVFNCHNFCFVRREQDKNIPFSKYLNT